jgi:class 3 adenylate cyclase/tetratricopeptide (TPR) repeat protein
VKCAACGFENAAEARFCGSCGQALEQRCPSCGEAVTPGLAFCTSCGAQLAEAAPAAAREERKVVTVLFCDLVGFTSRAEQLDPEDVRRVLSPFYARLRAELERFGGTVEKFIGDAVMALFGAPVAHEDDPERAVRAALAIREAVAGLNEENPGLDLQVRIAVNTGEAMISLSARPSEGEGMAAGDVVNSAARMQSAAPVGGILVGETTYRATRQAIEYRDAEPIAAKGKAEPVQVWEAVAARWRFGVDVAQPGGSELVGRGEELDLLRDALSRARRERASQLVTLVGEPGIGKSRLVFELFKAVDAEPDLTYWRQGRSLPYGEGVTFWALSEMAKSHSGVLETDSAESAEEKLRQAVAEAIADPVDVDWVLGHLRPLVGLAGDVELTADSRAEIFAAWRKFFEAIAEKRSLVLVFEDLQWADDGLLDFVDHLVEWASGVPLLCVCTARPELLERRPDWGGGKRNATTISLSPLSDDDTARLVHALLGTSVLPSELQSTLLARASGNPLYAEEFARLVEERRGEEGELPLPESVQGIIAARVDSLPPEEKELLQDAAVVGKVMWVGTVAALEGIERWTVEERLHALERKEFVRREQRSTLEGETEYAFRHILVRDVAYGQIPRSARAEKHRVVAEWIESIGERTEDRAEMLAHHYLSALEFSRASGQSTEALAGPARSALREAGDRAWGLSSPVTAKRFYESSLELWPDEEAGRAKLLFKYGRALRLVEDAQVDDVLAEATDALLADGDRETAAEAETVRAEYSWYTGEPSVAVEKLERALKLVEDSGPSAAKLRVLAERARLELFAGKAREAIDLGREALRMAETLEDDQARAELLNTIGVARFFADEYDRGSLEDLDQSVVFARKAGGPQALVRALFNVAETQMMVGNARRSSELFEALREQTKRFGLETFDRWQRGSEPELLYRIGRWDEAAARADEFIGEVEAGSSHYQVSSCRIARGKIRLGRADVEGALEDARRGADFARAAGDHQVLQPSLSYLASVQAALGETAEASAVADEVLELAPLVSMYVSDLAWAMRALGRGGEFLERALPDLPTGREAPLWRVAGRAVAADDLERAAEVYAQIGAVSDEAFARLVAAEERGTTGPELERALAFYREVGATAYLERGEALLAKSAWKRAGAARAAPE